MNMKKWCLFLTLYACACLLAACAASGGTAGETDVLPQEEPAGDTVVCRVISVLEGGTLILAFGLFCIVTAVMEIKGYFA